MAQLLAHEPDRVKVWGPIRVNPEIPLSVGVGDVIRLAAERFEVVAIVPPDPKRKVVGWVELAILPDQPF